MDSGYMDVRSKPGVGVSGWFRSDGIEYLGVEVTEKEGVCLLFAWVVVSWMKKL